MPFVPNATPSRRQPSREGFTRPDVLLQALEHYHDDSATSDLLFLMAWEVRPTSANPGRRPADRPDTPRQSRFGGGTTRPRGRRPGLALAPVVIARLSGD